MVLAIMGITFELPYNAALGGFGLVDKVVDNLGIIPEQPATGKAPEKLAPLPSPRALTARLAVIGSRARVPVVSAQVT